MTGSEPSTGSENYGGRDARDGGERLPPDVLLEVVRRSPLLAALRTSPASPSELEESLDVSRSTVHRAIRSLEELNLIEKRDGRYELTGVGSLVSTETTAYQRRISAAIALESFLNHVDFDDVPVEHFADAKITEPTPHQPHVSVRRIIELIEDSEQLRIFSTVISPFYVDTAHRQMLDGMEIQAIFDGRIIDIVLGEYEQEAEEALETGRFDVHVHPNLPFELFLFDDRIGMAAHDENGIARVFVETESPAAVEWATGVYEQYLAESTPITTEIE